MPTFTDAIDTVRFRSRVDLLLVAIIAIPLLAALGVSSVRAWSHGMGALVGTGLVYAVVLGLVGWIFCDTSYTLTATELQIRSGPVRATVPLATLHRVRRSHTLIAAPALSLRRLELDGRGGQLVIISPDDLDGFLAALRARVPSIILP